jgi:hypothetical protein
MRYIPSIVIMTIDKALNCERFSHGERKGGAFQNFQ